MFRLFQPGTALMVSMIPRNWFIFGFHIRYNLFEILSLNMLSVWLNTLMCMLTGTFRQPGFTRDFVTSFSSHSCERCRYNQLHEYQPYRYPSCAKINNAFLQPIKQPESLPLVIWNQLQTPLEDTSKYRGLFDFWTVCYRVIRPVLWN